MGKLSEVKDFPQRILDDIEWMSITITKSQFTKSSYGPNKFHRGRSEIAFWLDTIERQKAFFNLPQKLSNAKKSESKLGKGEGEEFNKRIFTMIGLSGTQNERKTFEEAFQTIEKWQFDSFYYLQVTKEHGFAYFVMKLIGKYMTFKSINVDPIIYCRMLQKLATGYNNKYFHGEAHIIDCLQAAHYFINECGLKQYFTDIQIFTIFTAICVHDYQHPYYY